MNNVNDAVSGGWRAAPAYTCAMLMLATLGIFVHELGLDAITTAFFRCVFGALMLALVCWWRGLFVRANFASRQVGLVLFSGVLMVLNWVAFLEAIARIGIAVATIVFHVQPFFVLGLAALLFRERIAAHQLGWIVVGFAGLILACGLVQNALLAQGGDVTGIACTLLGALGYAGVTLTTRTMRGMPPLLIALIHCSVGIVALGAFITLPDAGITPAQWGWMAGLGLIPTALAYVLIYGALPRMPTASVAVLTFVYPAAAVVVDFLVYGHRPGLLQAAGMAMIIVAGMGVSLRWRLRLTSAAHV